MAVKKVLAIVLAGGEGKRLDDGLAGPRAGAARILVGPKPNQRCADKLRLGESATQRDQIVTGIVRTQLAYAGTG